MHIQYICTLFTLAHYHTPDQLSNPSAALKCVVSYMIQHISLSHCTDLLMCHFRTAKEMSTPGHVADTWDPENNFHHLWYGSGCSLLKTLSGKGSGELNYHTRAHRKVARRVCIGSLHLHVEPRFSQCKCGFEILVAQTTGMFDVWCIPKYLPPSNAFRHACLSLFFLHIRVLNILAYCYLKDGHKVTLVIYLPHSTATCFVIVRN